MEQGLTHLEAKQRLSKFGKNTIEAESSYSFQKIFLSQFPTFINAILFIAGIFTFFIHDYIDSFFIFAVILINACFGFIQEYRAQKSLEKLKAYAAPIARVIREGKETEILAETIVPGDIIVLSEGFRVPADGKIQKGTSLEIDESILTGESLGVIKTEKDAVYLGTLVTKGKGSMLVEKTGLQTQFGRIAKTLAGIPAEKTPLQKNLDGLGKTLSIAALTAGLLIIPIGLSHQRELIPLILTGATIGLAAIPEGLPAVITIAFAVGTHRMAKQGAIVRKMAAIETLGAMQVVLVDKTGTITQNTMKVREVWIKDKSKLPQLLEACTLGNTASLIDKGSGKKYEVIGDRTDGALLVWAKEQIDQPLIPEKGHVIDEYVFDSETKTITTVWKQKDKKFVFVRGAPEAIIAKSILTQDEKETITKEYEALAKKGLRVIGFAMKTENHTGDVSRVQLEKNLAFLGFIGIFDPPREEVIDAVKKSRTAGIQVIMVTGDNELTALNLAKDIGLIEKDEDVITGEELGKMTDEELASVILKTRIFARTKPDEKLRIVTVLKNLNKVVGVTGDGVNDALALKKADVGVAMGAGGTDVAKEASDIILTDNNFATLIKAIEEGRIIYKNINNAVLYLISGNLAEISLVFFATLLQLPFPLLPTQILWINLVTDTLPALALATSSRDITVLKKKPRNANEPMLTTERILLICLIGFSLAGFLLVLFTLLLNISTEIQARAAVFNLLIYFHLLIVMIIGWQSLKKGNIFLILTVIIILILQLSINIFPFFRELFRLTM